MYTKYEVNHTIRGSAYNHTGTAEELLPLIIQDIFSHALPKLGKLDDEGDSDELFVKIVDVRLHDIGTALVLLADIELYKETLKAGRGLAVLDPVTVPVILSLSQRDIKDSLPQQVLQYYNNTGAYQSNYVEVGGVYYHGFNVTPYVYRQSDSTEYIKMVLQLLKEPWLKNKQKDWTDYLRVSGIQGEFEAIHRKSQVDIQANYTKVTTHYDIIGNKQVMPLVSVRKLPKVKVNNKRYEEGFNRVINTVVLALNKQSVQTNQAVIHFRGIYGIPTQWERILSPDNLMELYQRAIAIGLDTTPVKNLTFTLKVDTLTVLCSGNGFVLELYNKGYIKGEHSINKKLEEFGGVHPDFVKLLNVYDLRRSIYKGGAEA